MFGNQECLGGNYMKNDKMKEITIKTVKELRRYKNSSNKDEKWIKLKELIKYIETARDTGNIENEKGFSAALFLSKLLKHLKKSFNNEMS